MYVKHGLKKNLPYFSEVWVSQVLKRRWQWMRLLGGWGKWQRVSLREERNELQHQSTKSKLLFLPPSSLPRSLTVHSTCLKGALCFLTTRPKQKRWRLTLEFNGRMGENKADGIKLFFWSAISPYLPPLPRVGDKLKEILEWTSIKSPHSRNWVQTGWWDSFILPSALDFSSPWLTFLSAGNGIQSKQLW